MNKVQYKVANGVATVRDKKKYVSPEIEVINLDEQPKLLSASNRGTFGLNGNADADEEW